MLRRYKYLETMTLHPRKRLFSETWPTVSSCLLDSPMLQTIDHSCHFIKKNLFGIYVSVKTRKRISRVKFPTSTGCCHYDSKEEIGKKYLTPIIHYSNVEHSIKNAPDGSDITIEKCGKVLFHYL